MQVKKNIAAAIVAAVGMYLQVQAEGRLAAPVEELSGTPQAPAPGPVYSPWAMMGRQSAMEMRRFFQMRLVR